MQRARYCQEKRKITAAVLNINNEKMKTKKAPTKGYLHVVGDNGVLRLGTPQDSLLVGELCITSIRFIDNLSKNEIQA